MNKTLAITIGLLFLLVAGATAYFLLRAPTSPGEEPGNPFGGISGDTTPGGPESEFTVTGSDGANYEVPDFREGKTPIPGAGGNYYDLIHGGEPVFGDEGDRFLVQYGESDSSFTISLISEPLGETRQLAEEYLKNTLKLPLEQLCKLKITVGVPMDVNELYGRYENLGLSFCPGAVALP